MSKHDVLSCSTFVSASLSIDPYLLLALFEPNLSLLFCSVSLNLPKDWLLLPPYSAEFTETYYGLV